MSQLAEEALRAGACGVSTSRTILHSSKHGLVPGTDAPPEELLALGDAIGRAGHGVFQLVSDHQGGAGDRAWLVDLVERTGATATYPLAQAGYAPDAWRDALAATRRGPRRRPPHHPAGGRAGPPGCSSACSRRSTRSSPTRPTARSPTCRWPSGWPRLREPEVRAAPRSPRSRGPGTRSPAA